MEDQIERAQQLLQERDIDGWLLYEFGDCNELARQFLGVQQLHISRRLFYFIPKSGEPTVIAHAIEGHQFDFLPGKRVPYMGWTQMHKILEEMLSSCNCVCMEYSPEGAIPYLSKVDAGTVEMVQKCGVSVVSSGFLLGSLTSTLSQEQIQLHKEAASHLQQIVSEVWDFIGQEIKGGKTLYEGDVRDYIVDNFTRRKMITEGAPIVARAEHSALPHYFPSGKGSPIGEGDLVLVDLWGKMDLEGAIFADMTRMGKIGQPTQKEEEAFSLVFHAQRAAIDFIGERLQRGEVVKGFEVDEIARGVISDGGHGNHFTHRLGHNIGTSLHGHGTHLDSFETLDDRALLPETCFSVEPGIYMPGEFGVRLETDVLINHSGELEITAGLQNEIALVII